MPRMMGAVRCWLRSRASTEAPPDQPERPNPDRIAVLEHELLGIEPEPGTRAAAAVAMAKPVDQDACPHDGVIETTTWGQARPTGMCEHCGAHMVQNDEGYWHRP